MDPRHEGEEVVAFSRIYAPADTLSKVLAILYRGGDVAKQEPRLLGTIENQLGLRQWLESQGHEYIVRPLGTRI